MHDEDENDDNESADDDDGYNEVYDAIDDADNIDIQDKNDILGLHILRGGGKGHEVE